jgi:hypothetical protein
MLSSDKDRHIILMMSTANERFRTMSDVPEEPSPCPPPSPRWNNWEIYSRELDSHNSLRTDAAKSPSTDDPHFQARIVFLIRNQTLWVSKEFRTQIPLMRSIDHAYSEATLYSAHYHSNKKDTSAL